MIEKECRICFEKSYNNDLFINPCLCSGTSKWVHKECINTWRNMNKNKEPYKKCMECICTAHICSIACRLVVCCSILD